MSRYRMKWAIPLHPVPIDQSWVRAQLSSREIVCEFPRCSALAELAFIGDKEIPLLCSMHYDAASASDAVRLQVERHLWDTFDSMYNFIRRVHDSHGEVLVEIERVAEEEKQLAKMQRKLQREVVSDFMKMMRTSGIRIGSPDDELVEARGGQSPSRDDQLVFRRPEPLLNIDLIF